MVKKYSHATMWFTAAIWLITRNVTCGEVLLGAVPSVVNNWWVAANGPRCHYEEPALRETAWTPTAMWSITPGFFQPLRTSLTQEERQASHNVSFPTVADLVWLLTGDDFSLHWLPVWARSEASGYKATTHWGGRVLPVNHLCTSTILQAQLCYVTLAEVKTQATGFDDSLIFLSGKKGTFNFHLIVIATNIWFIKVLAALVAWHLTFVTWVLEYKDHNDMKMQENKSVFRRSMPWCVLRLLFRITLFHLLTDYSYSTAVFINEALGMSQPWL